MLLADQDRSRWNRLLIGRGLAALARAHALSAKPGSCQLQSAIAVCNARAATSDATDWSENTAN